MGIKRYAYVKTSEPKGRFNNSSYVDTLSKEAIAEFIRITYESYKNAVGDSFGETIPAIFTDEPQFSIKTTLPFATSHADVTLPWTTDFPDTFNEIYGYDIVEKIPELFWDLSENTPSQARYHYHDHICERFTQSFADQCGEWCENNGIALTAHMMSEDTLKIDNATAGAHIIEFKLFGNRINTFGALHNCSYSTWYGPDIWYTYQSHRRMLNNTSDNEFDYTCGWTYEYNLKSTGILTSPVIKVMKKS